VDTFTLSLASLTQTEYVYEILQHAVNVKQEATIGLSTVDFLPLVLVKLKNNCLIVSGLTVCKSLYSI
jgi:hypothetical protein